MRLMGRATLTDRNANQKCTDEFRRSGDIVGGQKSPSRRILDGALMGLENPIKACFRWIFDGPSMGLYAEEAGAEAPVS